MGKTLPGITCIRSSTVRSRPSIPMSDQPEHDTTINDTAPEVATSTEQASITEGESLEKIRDILFGSQKKDYESRFMRLEQELRRRSNDLRDEINKHFQSLESYVKSEIAAMHSKLDAEKDDRHRALQGLSRELTDLIHQKASALDMDLQKLGHLKTDRAQMASLLTDVAARLIEDPAS